MPTHGKPIDFTKIKPKTTGYIGSTYHRGTQLMTTPQKKLFMVRELPHTDVYRSKTGNIYRERRFNK
jgi:hypothetical protein